MNKNILAVSIGILLVIGILGFAVGRVTVPAPAAPAAPATQQYGSVASPDIQSPYFSVGGSREWFAHKENMVQATNTVCMLQSPAATSTLRSATVYFAISSTSASVVDLGYATTALTGPTATTTSIGGGSKFTLSANTFGQTIVASTTNGVIFAPNTYFVVRVDNGAGTFTPTGTCQAEWTQVAY